MTVGSVEGLKLGDGEVADSRFYGSNDVLVGLQLGPEWLKADHLQRSRCFKRSVNMIIFARNFGLI